MWSPLRQDVSKLWRRSNTESWGGWPANFKHSPRKCHFPFSLQVIFCFVFHRFFPFTLISSGLKREQKAKPLPCAQPTTVLWLPSAMQKWTTKQGPTPPQHTQECKGGLGDICLLLSSLQLLPWGLADHIFVKHRLGKWPSLLFHVECAQAEGFASCSLLENCYMRCFFSLRTEETSQSDRGMPARPRFPRLCPWEQTFPTSRSSGR